MASRRSNQNGNGHVFSAHTKHQPHSTPHPPIVPLTNKPSTLQSSSRLFPLPPPYARALSSSSVASSIFSITLADEEDDEVSDLLNATHLQQSAPVTPQRSTSYTRHLSSPLTLSHFDHSPIRTDTAHPSPVSPVSFPATFTAPASGHSASLLLSALELWRLQLLRSAFHDWLRHTRRRGVLHSAFDQWRQHKANAKYERTKTLHALQHWSHTQQHSAFHHWHNITTQPHRATQLYHSRLIQRLFDGWLGWVRRRKWLYETAHVVVDRGEENVKREVMGWWVGQVRQRRAADGWWVKRAGTRAIDRWRQRVAAERRSRWQLEQVEQLNTSWEKNRVRNAVTYWRMSVSQRRQGRQKAAKADGHYQRRVMRMWRQQVPAAADQKIMQKQQRAAHFHSLRLQRRALTAWHSSCALTRRQGEWLSGEENNRRKSRAFHSWLSVWQHTEACRAEQEQLAAQVHSTASVSAFSSLFAHWLRLTRLLILDRQRLSLAAEHDRSSTLISSISLWSSFSHRRRRARTMVSSADNRYRWQLLTGAWVLWSTTWRRSHAIEHVQAMMRRRLLDTSFGEWWDAVLHKRIAAGQQRRQHRSLRDALSCWHQFTHRRVQLAAALTHFHTTDSQRYQRSVITHWRTFYLVHHQRRIWLLRVTFSGWLQQLEEKREERCLMRHVVLQWRAEAVRFREQRLLSLRLYHQRLLLPAIATLRQHAQWSRSQREKMQLASSHYHRIITSHSHHSRYLRTAYLAWYYYTRHRRQLLQLSDTLQQRQAQVMLSSALSVWHQHSEQLRLADEWHRRYAQAQAISDWQRWTTQQIEDRQLNDALQQLWQQKQTERVRSALHCWYEWCCERRVDSAQQRMARLFLLRQLMAGWKRCVPADVRRRLQAKQQAAAQFSDKLVVKRVWRAWKRDFVQRREDRSQLTAEWQNEQTSKRLRAVWGEWREGMALLAQWNATAEQRLHSTRSANLGRLYGQWRSAFAQLRVDKANKVQAEQYHLSSLLRWSCRRWRVFCLVSQQRQRVVGRLIQSQHVYTLRAAMATWLHHTRLSQAAVILSAYTAQLQIQAAFSHWSELLLNERAETFHQQREQIRLSTSLAVWRDYSHTSQQQRQRAEQMGRLVASHRMSASFHAWISLTQRRRLLASQSSVVAALHDRHMVRAMFSAWIHQRRIHQRMRLHLLRRVFTAWRVERRKRVVERKQLAVVLKEWKAAARVEQQRETVSRHLLQVRTMRNVMGAWQSAKLTHHVFSHWRQRAMDIVSSSSQLQLATAHCQHRQQQLAIRLLVQHAQQSHHIALLQQHLSLSHHTYLLRLALSEWVQRWREVHAVSVMAAILARERQTTAWQRWQEAVWDERAQHFQHQLFSRQAASALQRWTANHRQHQQETTLITHCHSITARSLLGESLRHLTACYHLTRYVRSLEEAAGNHYTGRVNREVFAWWYNVSIIRRHMRATRLRGIWRLWRARVAELTSQRAAVIRTFHSWRDAAVHGKQCMQRAVLAYRQRHILSALATLSAFAQLKAQHSALSELAEQCYYARIVQETWLLWRQQQQLAMACRAQLDLAAQYSASSMCARAVTRWRQWRSGRRERVDENVVATQAMDDSKRRRAIRRWHRTAHQHRVVRSIQQLTTHPVLREWRRITTAVRTDKRQLLRAVMSHWAAAVHECKQERKVQQARQRGARRICGRIIKAWTALSGTHDVVRQAGENLKTGRRLRQLRDIFEILRTIASASSARSQQQQHAAVSFYHQHRSHRVLAGWQQLAATEHALHAEWDTRAERHWSVTAQRRVLDAWEERVSAALRQRHIAASQAVRLSIALRSYHTSLLLHTLSVWRAAYLATHYSQPSHHSLSTTSSDSPPPRLSSMRDLRAYIEQVRAAGRTGLTVAPCSPLSAATTETGSYTPSEASRPSTNDSMQDEQEERLIVRSVKRAYGAVRRFDRIPRIEMRDL